MWNDDKDNVDGFKVNTDFAKKFEKRKKMEELEKAKTKYGKKFDEVIKGGDGSGSESSEEDEIAELDTEEVNTKFLKTLAMIRAKSPKIYDKDAKFYDDKDFEGPALLREELKKKEKPVYYKDLVRKDLKHELKDRRITEETPIQEQERLKREFKMAANIEEEEEESEDDGLMKVKPKSQREIEDEKVAFKEFLEKQKGKSAPEEVDMLQRFWGDESKLDDTDKFLRKYLLTKGYVDKEDEDLMEKFQAVDQEDEAREEEMEEFEEKYNFRYEEPGADQVITYPREVPDTMRLEDSKRKEKRKEKADKLKEEKVRQEEEVKRLKNIAKEQILDRLKKIEEIAGTDFKDPKKFDKFLNDDFDPKEYDQKMQQEFDDDYYDEDDQGAGEIEDYVNNLEEEYAKVDDLDENEEKNGKNDKNGGLGADKENLLQPKTAIPIVNKVALKEEEVKEINNSLGGNIWYYCDTCIKGIKEGEPRFECLECDDFVQCKKCADLKDHPHKMKKFIVPKGCTPPSDEEIRGIVEGFKYCTDCNYKFTDFDQLYENKKKKDFLLCETCFKNDEKSHKEKDFNTIKPKRYDYEDIMKSDMTKLKDIHNDEVLNDLIDSYYKLDFEDIISGGIKTRFHYTTVPKNAYGLTDEQLLYSDDKLLNQFVSLKKLAPYRPDEGLVNMKSLKLKKQILKKDTEKNMKIINKEIKKVEREVVENKKKKGGKLAKLGKDGLTKLKNIAAVKALRKPRPKVQLVSEEQAVADLKAEEEAARAAAAENGKKKSKIPESRLKAYGLK